MNTSSLIALIVSLLLSVLCCGIGIFLFLLVLGFILMRRRGKKPANVKEAVKAGAESVSQVFTRGKGGLQGGDDDDEDDD